MTPAAVVLAIRQAAHAVLLTNAATRDLTPIQLDHLALEIAKNASISILFPDDETETPS